MRRKKKRLKITIERNAGVRKNKSDEPYGGGCYCNFVLGWLIRIRSRSFVMGEM